MYALLGFLLAAAPADIAGVVQELHDVRKQAFPELVALPLTTGEMTSDTVFFQSNFDAGAALDGRLELSVDINPRIFDDGPPLAALRAVLAHELAHSLDYLERFGCRGVAGLVDLAPMLFWAPVQETVERRADVVTVARGFGPGLALYRAWLYRHLDAEAVLDKRRVYYSPLELDLLDRLFRGCPDVKARAIAAPPRTSRDIVALGPACF